METRKSNIGQMTARAEEIVDTFDGVQLAVGQGFLMFSIAGSKPEDKTRMLAAKRAVGDALIAEFPGRKFRHMRSGGYRVWWWIFGGRAEGLRCGIDIVLEEFEHDAILLGPGAWKAIVG